MSAQGSVGTPLPGTEVRVVTENVDGEKEVREFSIIIFVQTTSYWVANLKFFFLIPVNQVIAEGNEHGSHVSSFNEGREGELQVRGPSVFKWLVSISA